MIDLKNIDTILYIDNSINEGIDDRVYNTGAPDWSKKGDTGDMPDFKLLGAYTFGKTIRNSLDGMSAGFYNKVTDFGNYVIVTIGYNNILTGRSAEKNYLIVFSRDNKGRILSMSNRWRTINGPNQAISYIKSAASVLQSYTNNKD